MAALSLFVYGLLPLLALGNTLDDRKDLESRKSSCGVVSKGQLLTNTVSNLAVDTSFVEMLSPITRMAAMGVALVGHITKGFLDLTSTALGCDDIPFEEIKQVVNERMDELDAKMNTIVESVDKMGNMVRRTYQVVEQMRMEMQRGFQEIVDTINEVSVKQFVTQISIFVEYFETESDRISVMDEEECLKKLEEEGGILPILKKCITPNPMTLYSAMNSIILNDYAIPKHADDKVAFQALYVLFYGLQTYAAVFAFLMKSYVFIANHYFFQLFDIDQYNTEIDKVSIVFEDFTSFLADDGTGFCDKIEKVWKRVQEKSFIKNVDAATYKKVKEKSNIVAFIKSQLNNMSLPFVDETPEAPTVQPNSANVKTPKGQWVRGTSVRYALQYEKNGVYSKIGEWSEPFVLAGKAFPIVEITSEEDMFGIVYRQFKDSTPVVAITLPPGTSNFRDIHRELYEAAGELDEAVAFRKASDYIKLGASPDSIFEDGRAPVHNAAITGNAKLFAYLKENSRNADVQDKLGYTPLHLAVKHNHPEIIPDMLKLNVAVNLAGKKDGFTPLLLAVSLNSREAVKALLQCKDVDVNAKATSGLTALHLAMKGDDEIVEALMKRTELDVNSKSREKQTAAHFAAMHGNTAHLRILKKRPDFDPNVRDKDGLTALHFAAMLGKTEVVTMLLGSFPKLEVSVAGKRNKWTPLHYAIFFRQVEAAVELIDDQRVDVNAATSDGVTPLHLAVATNQDGDIYFVLLERGVNVHAKTSQGDTAMHIAAINDCSGCVAGLYNFDADNKAKNKDGKTPLDLAKEYKSNNVIRFMG